MWKEPCPDCGAWGTHYCTSGQRNNEWYTTDNICTHPEHFPPMHMVIYHPYIHTCPECGYQVKVQPNVTIC
jgi:predicted RNA-binding Zn-ribbon protein involved in translation (DUF1610 family)